MSANIYDIEDYENEPPSGPKKQTQSKPISKAHVAVLYLVRATSSKCYSSSRFCCAVSAHGIKTSTIAPTAKTACLFIFAPYNYCILISFYCTAGIKIQKRQIQSLSLRQYFMPCGSDVSILEFHLTFAVFPFQSFP